MSSVCNIIPEQNKSVLGKKQISIHSEDRDIRKYPDVSNFSIILPEKLENIKSLTIKNIAIPTTLYNFSEKNMNTKFYISLNSNITKEYLITIPNGQYCANELAEIIQKMIAEILGTGVINVNYNSINHKIIFKSSMNFSLIFNKTINYNCINNNKYKGIEWYLGFEKKIYNSRKGDSKEDLISKFPNQRVICLEMNFPFELINEETKQDLCSFLNKNITYVKKSWITKGNCKAILNNNEKVQNTTIVTMLYESASILNQNIFIEEICNCFEKKYNFYNRNGDNININIKFDYEAGNINIPLEYQNVIVFKNPNSKDCFNVISSPKSINIMGDPVIYIEVDKFNSIDELVPFPQATSSSINSFNTYGGKVNSALSSIPLVRNKEDCIFPGNYEFIDASGFLSNKKEFFYNSIESVKILNFKFRHHDGRFVDFSGYDIFFTLEFEILMPDAISQFNSREIRNNYS